MTIDKPALYEIRIQGHLDSRRALQFEGLTLTHTPDGETIIYGMISDQAALHGVLSKIRDLGIPLLSVNRMEFDQVKVSKERIDLMNRVIDHISPIVTGSLLTVFMIAQIALSFLLYNQNGIAALRTLGWVIWALSAIFGVLPIVTFRKLGNVSKGENYMKTTTLVDSGIYAIVRHPQYLAGIFINIALMLIAQHWLIVLLGIPPMLLTVLDAHRADQNLVDKFGEEYEAYKRKVPGLNFLLGVARLIKY